MASCKGWGVRWWEVAAGDVGASAERSTSVELESRWPWGPQLPRRVLLCRACQGLCWSLGGRQAARAPSPQLPQPPGVCQLSCTLSRALALWLHPPLQAEPLRRRCAPPHLLSAELRHLVVRPPQLEALHGLQVLALQQDGVAASLAARWLARGRGEKRGRAAAWETWHEPSQRPSPFQGPTPLQQLAARALAAPLPWKCQLGGVL